MAENLKTLNGYGFNAVMLDGKTFYEIMLSLYPVGSIYLSVDSTSPASLFGGTWQQIQDRFLLGAGGNYDVLSYGGSESHAHSLSKKGYALVTIKGGGSVNYRDVSTPTYTTTYGVSTGYSGSSATNTGYDGAELGGNTDSTTNLPPYLAVYMWVRVS